MTSRNEKRRWYIVRVPGDIEILMLVSGLSEASIRKQVQPKGRRYIIQPATHWHVLRIFSESHVSFNTKDVRCSTDPEKQVCNELYVVSPTNTTRIMVLS